MQYAPQDPNPVAPFAQTLDALSQANLYKARRDQIRQESMARFQGMGTPGASIAFQPQPNMPQNAGLGQPGQDTRDQLGANAAGAQMMGPTPPPAVAPQQAPQPQFKPDAAPMAPQQPQAAPAGPPPLTPDMGQIVRFRQALAPMLAQQPHLLFRNLSQALGSNQAAQELIGQGPISPDTLQRLQTMAPMQDTSGQVGTETPAMTQERGLAEAQARGGQFAAGPVGQEPVEPGSFGETAQTYGPQMAAQLSGQDIQRMRWQRQMGMMERKLMAGFKDPIYQGLEQELGKYMSPAGIVLDEARKNETQKKLDLRQAVVAQVLAGVPPQEAAQSAAERYPEAAQKYPELLNPPPIAMGGSTSMRVGGGSAAPASGQDVTPGWVKKLKGSTQAMIMQARAKGADWATIIQTPEVKLELSKTNYKVK